MPRSRSYSAASDYERRRRQQEREAERSHKAALAAQRSADREAKRQYITERVAEADRRTHALDDRVEELRTLLVRGLRRPGAIDLNKLRRHVTLPPLDLGSLGPQAAPPSWSDFEPPAPSALGRMFGAEGGATASV